MAKPWPSDARSRTGSTRVPCVASCVAPDARLLEQCFRHGNWKPQARGLGGNGKPWRIGTEVYGDRDIFPRDVISRKLSVPNAERIFFNHRAKVDTGTCHRPGSLI